MTDFSRILPLVIERLDSRLDMGIILLIVVAGDLHNALT